jgi:hypothetical protein
MQSPRNTEPDRWYLAYGSNLSSETFRGRRGIRPLAQTNVIVPSLELTFDLPGIPYLEPCFANVRRRKDDGANTRSLIGVAYLVTAQDYARIIATKGGGLSYEEVVIKCRRLQDSSEKTIVRIGDAEAGAGTSMQDDGQDQVILAYALLAHDIKQRSAPVQPSKRYINIIRAGARGMSAYPLINSIFKHTMGNPRKRFACFLHCVFGRHTLLPHDDSLEASRGFFVPRDVATSVVDTAPAKHGKSSSFLPSLLVMPRCMP